MMEAPTGLTSAESEKDVVHVLPFDSVLVIATVNERHAHGRCT